MTALLCALVAAAPIANVNADGTITHLIAGFEPREVHLEWRVPMPGWNRMIGAWDARDLRHQTVDGGTRTTGVAVGDETHRYRFEQLIREVDGKVVYSLTVTAETDGDSEGVFLFLDVPRAVYAGGRATLGASTATMPVEKPAARHFLTAEAAAAELAAPAGQPRLTLEFDRALPLTVQDTRDWNGTSYTLFARLAGGLKAGQSASVTVSLSLTAEADTRPARLTLRADERRYRFAGFGGNFCFNIESPVTDYNLRHLRVAHARTELTAVEWEPENDNADPSAIDQAAFARRDVPGSNLRREFELAQRLHQAGIPLICSIWPIPEWLTSDPGQGPEAHGRVIPRALWPEMIELVTAYLLHAKQQYGVEFGMFSFNEPDWGVRVKFTPEEHRDFIKLAGPAFAAAGLSCKLLVGDVTNPRGTHTYCVPALEDPEARRWCAGISFHSWGGATPEQYAAWSDLAEQYGLPLLVGELGLDAAAWRNGAYNHFPYALAELRHVQELLLWARPQATMQWEYTSDYGIARDNRDGTVTPLPRFHLVRQFSLLTPPDAWVLGTASDHEAVRLTAFRGEAGLTLHLDNGAGPRRATIVGLPAEVTSLRAVRTSETEAELELAPVPVRDGRVELDLPAGCLVTLTTLPKG